MLKAGLLGSSRNTEKPQKAETKITDKQEQRLGNRLTPNGGHASGCGDENKTSGSRGPGHSAHTAGEAETPLFKELNRPYLGLLYIFSIAAYPPGVLFPL